MFNNPFTPSFGGKPDFFFGRKEILLRFENALTDRGSAERVLFLTGNRGCGKTALLEQCSQMAAAHGWRTIDLNSENALSVLVRNLVRHRESTKTLAPEASVNVLGSGISLGGISSSETTAYDKEDLGIVFLEACRDAKQGVFVSIDEVQKVDLKDLSLICGAFQMASRKGYDVMLAVAGLPYAYDAVIQYEGCTYMRRCAHERISVFTHSETYDVLREAFEHAGSLEIDERALDALVEASFGHPYLIQLAGYCLVRFMNEQGNCSTYTIDEKDVRTCLPEIIHLYTTRSLEPIVSALPASECRYLTAMAHVLDTERIAKTADIAKHLGKSLQQVSPIRQRLLNEGNIVAVGRGKLMFNIPYLQEYLLSREPQDTRESALAREWRF